MNTSNRIEIQSTFEPLFNRAADIARWPQFLPHYRYVRIEQSSEVQGPTSNVINEKPWTDSYIVAEMAARHYGVPLWWRTIQIPLPQERRIVFKHIGGITKGMDVQWVFTPCDSNENKWRVEIHHQFAPAWPVPGLWFADHVIGNGFVKQVAAKTLQRLKETVEGGGTLYLQ